MSFKFYHLAFIFLFIIPIVNAHEGNETHEHYDFETLKKNITLMDSYLKDNDVQVPGALNFLIKEGNIEINISKDGLVEGFYISIQNEKINGISFGFPEESNYIILTNEETINNILNSQDISGEIVNSYNEKDIEIKANGVGNKVRLFFGKIILKFIA